MITLKRTRHPRATMRGGCQQKAPTQNPDDAIRQFCRKVGTDSLYPADDEADPMFQAFWREIQTAAVTALAHRRDEASKWHLRGSEGSPTWLVQTLDEQTRKIALAADQYGIEFPGDFAALMLDFAGRLKARPSFFLAAERDALTLLASKAGWFLPMVPAPIQEQPE